MKAKRDYKTGKTRRELTNELVEEIGCGDIPQRYQIPDRVWKKYEALVSFDPEWNHLKDGPPKDA